jgi:putative cardiolipin synthase
VVDRFAAVVGGRNVGDEYFDASATTNFSDLDLVAFGPAAREIGMSFDVFWDSPAAHPIGELVRKVATAGIGLEGARERLSANFEKFRESDYLAALRDGSFVDELASEAGRAYWGKSEVVFDDPSKIDPEFRAKRRRWRKRWARMTPRIVELLASAKSEVTLISPYFVPAARGTALFKALRARGVRVRILTNSLAATDVPAVHAGYERYRRKLLKCGVEIWEMRADPNRPRRRYRSGSGASLHAKAFTVDGEYAFVGSMNLDPRSAFLNTELGIIVPSPDLARRIHGYYDELARLDRSYKVSLEERGGLRRLRWDWIDANHHHLRAHREPDASWDRRLMAQIIAWLPLERHL